MYKYNVEFNVNLISIFSLCVDICIHLSSWAKSCRI